MLGKFLSWGKGKKSGEKADVRGATGFSPLERLVPPLTQPPQPPTDAGQTIDTQEAEVVVSRLLPIDTHGPRTQSAELLARFLGRQPVLDAHGRTVGDELRLKKPAPPPGPAARTLLEMHDEMLLSSLVDLDLSSQRGDRLIFVPLSPWGLLSGFLDRLPGEGVVLALPGQACNDAVEPRLVELRAKGFRLALDDPDEGTVTRLAPEFVRIDTRHRDALRLARESGAARAARAGALIALGVDAEEVFDACRKLGFDAFQGYSFTRLAPARANHLTAERLRVVELLNMVLAHAEIQDIEAVFKRDPALSFRLLRYINSAASGLVQPVRSLAHALMVLGTQRLYRWLTLLLFGANEPDFRTRALMRTALVRARFAELIAIERPREFRETVFIVGMFSALDALLNLPMAQALAPLRLPPDIVRALVEREGPYAPYLEIVLATEEGEETILCTYAAALGLSDERLNAAQAEALAWVDKVEV